MEEITSATAASGLGSRSARKALDALGELSVLDPLARAARAAVRRLPLGQSREVLHGTWLGHPVHPALVQVPLGSWMSAAVLDLVPGNRRAAAALVGLGLLGAGPGAVAGWVDWAEQSSEQQRTGLVHAAANLTATGLYSASLLARLGGRPVRGRILGWSGLTVAAVGGIIGGHLAYRQGTGMNQAGDVAQLAEPGWQTVGPVDELPVGEPVRRDVGDIPVVVLHHKDGTVHVLAEHCNHLSGPLSQGTLEDDCLRCPWHGSLFRLSDGEVLEGPATSPQPAFATRVIAGCLLIRAPGA
ncbi:Rieske (2Fe-2S) protein [Streptacidiphilus melanogenes]|uniref:Rieske (2Fe-2S) protein n=1 Tax=Streptacidiphilus melanogenes TaxID=411235 RepID=UPI00069504A1|nr:Rieske (2Fe-2S) protein [Streptacidiphilus melanogenes]